MNNRFAFTALASIALPLALGAFAPACASDQKRSPTAEEVRDGEALPPAPPVPADYAANPPSGAATTNNDTPATTAAPAADTPAPATAKETLSEAQVAKIAELVNTAEIEQGKLAQGKAKATNVRKFADMMVKHHGDAKAEQTKLFKKLNLTPADSATAATLKAEGDQTLDTLKKTEASGFDAAYVQSQVDGHQKVLDALDSQLLTAAKTPELVDGLRKMRATVESHLTEAKKLQASK